MTRSSVTSVAVYASRNTSFLSVMTLAWWRLRRTGLLLFAVALGLISAVIVSCALPLFFPITTTAGLRGMLRQQATNVQITCTVTPLGLSSQVVQNIQQQIIPLFQQNVGNYLAGRPQLSIDSSNMNVLSPTVSQKHQFQVLSTSIQEAAPYLTLVQGRLPRLTSTPARDIEILMTPDTASGLHVHLGSIMKLGFSFYKQLPDQITDKPVPGDPSTQPTGTQFTAHVVGLFTINTTSLTYWQGQDFEPYITSSTDSLDKRPTFHYSLLLPTEGLLGVYDGLNATYHTKAPFAIFDNTLTWSYFLNPAQFTSAQLDSTIQHMAHLKSAFDVRYGELKGTPGAPYDPANPPPFPYISQATLLSPLLSTPNSPSNLEQYRSNITVIGVPTFLIALQIIGLILFFVSLMTDVLVERQADTIAILRSRGASRSQIFGALLTQSIILGIIAVIVGVPLAVLAALFITQHILPSATGDALDVVSTHLVSSALGTLSYAVVVVLVMLFTMSFSLERAARMDVLLVRRNASRLIHKPLWQRLRLDVIVGVIALFGALISLYLSRVGTLLSSTTQAVVVVPLTLIAPLFLVLGCLLLSLRLLPLLLQWGARVAGRGRSATSMLAMAQMARLPQQAIRMTLLLALAIGFTLFGLIFSASQEQHISDAATYQTEADFSGNIPMNSPQRSVQSWTKLYQTMPGVTSSSVGYASNAVVLGGQSQLPLYFQAVDSSTFANTAILPQGASSQSLSSLMTLLASKRQEGEKSGIIPVIVDSMVSNKFALHIGSTFHINVTDNSLLANDFSCIVVRIVQSIPTPNAAPTNDGLPTGSILTDYQTLSAVYTQAAQSLLGKANAGIIPNYVWLRTSDDANAITQARAALTREDFYLSNLQDRRAIIDQQHADPLTITLIGMLNLGIVVTLLLAILGDILTSWLTVYTRLTNFVVLRALGTSPRQVASVLGWEQVLVYSAGLLLGVAFGTLLANTIVPTLITHNTIGVDAFPTRLIIPSTLIIVLLCVFIVFVAALGMMIYTVSKPSMSQTLRLNED